jgi:hypothetical protein
MKFTISTVLVVMTFVALLFGVAYSQKVTAVPVKNWEYKQLFLSAYEDSTQQLNKMGNDGWELVNVAASCPNIENCRLVAFLKRPKL